MKNKQKALVSRELELHLSISLSMLRGMLKCRDAYDKQSKSINFKKTRTAFEHLLEHAQRHAQKTRMPMKNNQKASILTPFEQGETRDFIILKE